MCDFQRKENWRTQGKTLEQGLPNHKLNPHMKPDAGFKPWLYWQVASACIKGQCTIYSTILAALTKKNTP